MGALDKETLPEMAPDFLFFFLNVRFYSTTHDMKGLGNQVTKIVSFPRESFKFINERHFLKNGAINDQMSSLACVTYAKKKMSVIFLPSYVHVHFVFLSSTVRTLLSYHFLRSGKKNFAIALNFTSFRHLFR